MSNKHKPRVVNNQSPQGSRPMQMGRDLSNSAHKLTFNGIQYPLKFCNRAARITEDIYANEYGRDIGYYSILTEYANHRHSAITAICYGALVAAGCDMSWEDFDNIFTLDAIDNAGDLLHKGIEQSLPTPDERKN